MPKTLRFKFKRGTELKYIAHLDTLRLFERAIKRSGLPIAYTQGFNPRQKLVFGLPMSIGLTSESEYADIELQEEVSIESFIESINSALPTGIHVLGAVENSGRDNIMSQITAAKYEITFKTHNAMSRNDMDTLVHDLLSKEEIKVMKKTKKGKREVNIRPLIYSMSCDKKGNDTFVLEALLSAGAENNLRADLLMEAINNETGIVSQVVSMHRKALYASTFNEWKDPFEVANG